LRDYGVRIRGQIAVGHEFDLTQSFLARFFPLFPKWYVLYFGRDFGDLVKEVKLTLEKLFLCARERIFDVFNE
jgi:hypothetical protein